MMGNQECIYDKEIDVASATTSKIRKSLEYQSIARRKIINTDSYDNTIDIGTVELTENDLKAISVNNQDKTYYVDYKMRSISLNDDIDFSKVCHGAKELQQFITLLYKNESNYDGHIRNIKIQELVELPSKFILQENEEINNWFNQKTK